MRKIALSIAASLVLLLGFATPAWAYPPSAVCAANAWYLHAPYIVNGGIQAWATCMNNYGQYPWPDNGQPSWNGDAQLIEIRTHTNQILAGQNFESNRVLQQNTNSIVASSAYVPGATYKAAFRFRTAAGAEWWMWSSDVVR